MNSFAPIRITYLRYVRTSRKYKGESIGLKMNRLYSTITKGRTIRESTLGSRVLGASSARPRRVARTLLASRTGAKCSMHLRFSPLLALRYEIHPAFSAILPSISDVLPISTNYYLLFQHSIISIRLDHFYRRATKIKVYNRIIFK